MIEESLTPSTHPVDHDLEVMIDAISRR